MSIYSELAQCVRTFDRIKGPLLVQYYLPHCSQQRCDQLVRIDSLIPNLSKTSCCNWAGFIWPPGEKTEVEGQHLHSTTARTFRIAAWLPYQS